MKKPSRLYVLLALATVIILLPSLMVLHRYNQFRFYNSDFFKQHLELIEDASRHYQAITWYSPQTSDELLDAFTEFSKRFFIEEQSKKHKELIIENHKKYHFYEQLDTGKVYVFFIPSKNNGFDLKESNGFLNIDSISFITFLLEYNKCFISREIDYTTNRFCTTPGNEYQSFGYRPEYWYEVFKDTIPTRIRERLGSEGFLAEQWEFTFFMRYNRKTKVWNAEELCDNADNFRPLKNKIKRILEYEFHRNLVEIHTDSVIFPVYNLGKTGDE